MFVEALIAVTSTFLLTLAINTLGKKSLMLLSHLGRSLAFGQVLLRGDNT
jgi:hypothetical protein